MAARAVFGEASNVGSVVFIARGIAVAKRKTRTPQSQRLPLEGSFPDYLPVASRQLGSTYTYVEEIARGKTGVAHKLALRANEEHFVCLKTVRQDIEAQARLKTAETLRNEVEILLPLRHRSLPAVLDRQLGGEQPFYVCTYHPGVTFAQFKDDGRRLDFRTALYVIWSLLDVLEYLHKKGRTHCDLHAKNALISEEVFRDGIMVIDFGSGHRESGTPSDTSNRGNVNFKPLAGQRRDRQSVNRHESQLDFQTADFAALGVLLAIMADCFTQNAPIASQRAYEDFSTALQRELLSDWREVHEFFKRVIDPYRIASENSHLFVSQSGQPQYIQMPGGKAVVVGQAPLAVINTQTFQRLRGIKQLSFCDWHFPGANHSRFEHSIGVFGMAKRAVDHLVHDPLFREAFTPVQVRGLLLAALIHDVGHYPFAHMLEQYAASRFPDSEAAKDLVSHEKHGIMLMESDPELTTAIRKHWGEKALIQAKKTLEGTIPVLSDLIDGPIDVDKIDYLVRDAVHCGVAFGRGLDVEGLLKSLRCVSNRQRLGIEECGISAAEGLMILQDQMLSSVYWHETVRGTICMFHAVLAYIVKTDEGRLRQVVNGLKDCASDVAALNSVILPAIDELEGSDRKQLRRLVEVFMAPSYPELYRPIRTYRKDDDVPQGSMLRNVYDLLVPSKTHSSSQVPIEWGHVKSLRDAFIAAFKEKRIEMESLHLVVDVPYGKASRKMVYVRLPDRDTDAPMTEVSHLSPSIFNEPAQFLSPVRVYIAPKICDKAGNRLESIIASAEERFYSGKQIPGE